MDEALCDGSYLLAKCWWDEKRVSIQDTIGWKCSPPRSEKESWKRWDGQEREKGSVGISIDVPMC